MICDRLFNDTENNYLLIKAIERFQISAIGKLIERNPGGMLSYKFPL